jgi:hypothetical protein
LCECWAAMRRAIWQGRISLIVGDRETKVDIPREYSYVYVQLVYYRTITTRLSSTPCLLWVKLLQEVSLGLQPGSCKHCAFEDAPTLMLLCLIYIIVCNITVGAEPRPGVLFGPPSCWSWGRLVRSLWLCAKFALVPSLGISLVLWRGRPPRQ